MALMADAVVAAAVVATGVVAEVVEGAVRPGKASLRLPPSNFIMHSCGGA